MTITQEVQARRALPAPALARELRRSAGVSQARVAQELGVTPVTVSRWEAGARRPRGALLVAYAKLLDELRRAAG